VADQKISALPAVVAASGTDEIHTNESGVSKKVTIAQIATFIGSSPITVKALASNLALANNTPEKVTGLDQAVGIGTWVFKYYVRYRSDTITTGIRIGVNHSGTVTSFVANLYYVCDVSVGADTANQSSNNPGFQMGAFSVRAKNSNPQTTIGGVDTANADMLVIIEGLAVVTVSGDLQLYATNEIASADVTVMENSSLVLTKIA
jgi:hypothetical protein